MATDFENRFPAQGASHESLSAPTGQTKVKTNVNKFAIVAIGIVAFMFLVFGGMMYLKIREPSMTGQGAQPAVQPGFSEHNVELEAANIERQKARIREAEAARAAEEARLLAEMERRMREMQPVAAPVQPPVVTEEDPEARAMRAGVLLPLIGTASDARTHTEQRQRELEAQIADFGSGGADASAFLGSGAGMAGRLNPTVLPARAAGRLENLSYLLKKGTTIPCALRTGIDTQLPGFVLCNVINDVYSANGKTLLIERGATLFGEQQSSLRAGQERSFVIWSRIDNPSGVTVNIDSPATDAMGFSGVPGIVNHRFMERFGAAILLTTIRDFSRVLAESMASNRNNQQVLIGSDGSFDGMAEEVLRNTINIPPTLIVKPATVVHVMVARDVSFENVYAVIR